MMKQAYIDAKVTKNLQKLCRSGKQAALAATKVEEIISRIQSGGAIPNRVGTVTKHGELRIKGVMKYDLGSGYRLITFKHGDCFFLLYAGSHDECHRWIENNRELTIDQIQERCELLPICTETTIENQSDSFWEPEDEWDPLRDIDEQVLRRVFRGLVDGLN
jgi:hypothetical protein